MFVNKASEEPYLGNDDKARDFCTKKVASATRFNSTEIYAIKTVCFNTQMYIFGARPEGQERSHWKDVAYCVRHYPVSDCFLFLSV